MYNCQMVWRKKKMRYVIVGCLGISLMVSLLMVVCSVGNTRIDQYQPREYHLIYEEVGVRDKFLGKPNRRVIQFHTQVNVIESADRGDGKVADAAERSHHRHHGNDKIHKLNGHGDDMAGDEAYDDYDEEVKDGKDNDGVRNERAPNNQTFRDQLPSSHHHDDGFVMDDNVPDYEEDGDYEDDDDDDDDNADEDEKDYQYANPPFKKGDFDYDSNNSRSAAFKIHYEAVNQSTNVNNSQRYNAGQYKSMHLLEDKRNMQISSNNATDTVISRRYANNNATLKKDRPVHVVSVSSLDSNHSPPFSRQSSHIPKPRRDKDPNTFSTTNFGYRKDGISYPGSANTLIGDRIETQIPIQNGGIDSWMLQEQPATQIQMPELPWQPGEVRSPEGVPLIVDKIFWSHEVEDLIAKGITDEDFEQFLHKLQTTPVKEMHAPQWNRCGRPSNQYVVLRDGTPLCARFRDEHVKLLHGELLSFYLSRILGLDNVPIVALSEVNTLSTQWRGMNLSSAGWNESSIVALIQWIDGLESERSRVKMPSVILEAYERGSVFGRDHPAVYALTANNLTEIVQWSDLILFDYLTGHYDRVASMQDGADREQKPSIMHENIRNLRKVWQKGKMWLIDNESGLFDGYELLYRGGEMGRKFVEFHQQMLATNCVFRRQTVHKILQLARLVQPHEALLKYTSDQDILYKKLPYAKETILFQKYFHVRLKEVVAWIHKCQHR